MIHNGDSIDELTQLLEYPDELYSGYEITEIGYNRTQDRVYLLYEGNDLTDGWDQLIFSNAEWNDGDPVLLPGGRPPGILSPEQARNNDTPEAEQAKHIYALLEHAGVEVRQ